MKPHFVPFALCVGASLASAHSHIDVRPDPHDATRLAFAGVTVELALFVYTGEPFSGYAPQFPGGFYATELTFSSEDPDGSQPRIELLAVTGPDGAQFGFWEVGATTATWTVPTGWSAAPGDVRTFVTYEDGTGYGHIHGRIFTVNYPGDYTFTVRAVDDAGLRQPSAPWTVSLTALAPPRLSLTVEHDTVRLRFASRAFLTYDLQVSTDLRHWENVPAHRFVAGTGGEIEMDDPIAGRTRVFYRLVEYR